VGDPVLDRALLVAALAEAESGAYCLTRAYTQTARLIR